MIETLTYALNRFSIHRTLPKRAVTVAILVLQIRKEIPLSQDVRLADMHMEKPFMLKS